MQLDGNGSIIKTMKESVLYPRYIQTRLIESLTDSPVVLVHGPRQFGKTTLAKPFGDSNGFYYLSFDDDVQKTAARTDPVGLSPICRSV